MALLFDLMLSNHKKGFGKPCVAATEAAVYGVYRDGVPYAPDAQAVRDALPHYYRKAYDRAGGTFWWSKHGDNDSAYLTLNDRRGKWLNTLYAVPRDFNP